MRMKRLMNPILPVVSVVVRVSFGRGQGGGGGRHVPPLLEKLACLMFNVSG